MISASVAALAEEFLRSMLMARIKNTAMAALVAIGIATAGAAALEPQSEKTPSASDPQQELLNLMHAWTKALVQSDVGTMDRLLAYEMFGTDPAGGLWDKSKYLENERLPRRVGRAQGHQGSRLRGCGRGDQSFLVEYQLEAVAVHRAEEYEHMDQAPRNLAMCRLANDGH
jgi:hypothetical protein